MALELRSKDGTTRVFRGPVVVGRAEGAALREPRREVSAHHAELRWVSGSWWVRDLGSTNGTYVDGRRLQAGEEHVLARGSRLGFAQVDGWTVQAAREPVQSARTDDGREVLPQGGILAIPDSAEPVVTVVSQDESWIAEWADGRNEATHDGAVLTVDGVDWTLCLPASDDTTSELGATAFLHDIALRFYVSRDEEHVQTHVHIGETVHTLTPRTHHYTLLTLARCRLQDALADELPDTEQGWVLQSRLERMLASGQNVIYKHIYRSRRELAELGVVNAADIVERRPAAGQLRIGVRDLTVERG